MIIATTTSGGGSKLAINPSIKQQRVLLTCIQQLSFNQLLVSSLCATCDDTLYTFILNTPLTNIIEKKYSNGGV
jgi:hypothetical protein